MVLNGAVICWGVWEPKARDPLRQWWRLPWQEEQRLPPRVGAVGKRLGCPASHDVPPMEPVEMGTISWWVTHQGHP